MRRLYLVTHAQSVHQVEGLTGGWYDTGLTATGRHQAERIAAELQRQIDGEPVALFTSDLLRAVETAQAVARRFAVEPVAMPYLRELRHGEAEGRPRNWLHEHENPLPTTGERLAYRICAGAELLSECARRIYAGMSEILAAGESNLIVVSHSFVLTYVVMAWLQVPFAALGHGRLVAIPAGLTLLREDGAGRRSLVYLSQTAHLSSRSLEQAIS